MKKVGLEKEKKAFKFKKCNVIYYTDNMNCETILSVGFRNIRLQPLVLDIFLAWKPLNMKVTVVYISRNHEIIEYADKESRNFDLHDFSVDSEFFLVLNDLFGSFELDCFASRSNKKCIRYYSKFEDVNSEGLNFFAQILPHCNLFVNGRVIRLVSSVRSCFNVKLSGVSEDFLKYYSKIDEAMSNGVADSTKNAYYLSFNRFANFCAVNNVPSLPSDPEVIITYFIKILEEGKNVSSVFNARSAIRY